MACDMRVARVLALLWLATTASAQPVVTAVRSAATNNPPTLTSGLSPQMLVAIMGENLSTTSATTATYPWPAQLGGATVTFNGVQAALEYASPSQINAVLPGAVHGSTSATVVVTTSAGSSVPVSVPIASSALGIFTQDWTGCGQAVALNIHSDGSVSVNTPQNSLDPVSDWGLMLLATGVGAFQDRTDGVPWQFSAADNRVGLGGVNAFFGIPNLGSPALTVPAFFGIPSLQTYAPPLNTTYAGPMPGQSGLDQVNVALTTSPSYPKRAPEGCRVPMYILDPATASQLVNVSIHSGGGPCSDSPLNSLGLVTWEQNTVSGLAGSSSTSAVNVQFPEGPKLDFALPPAHGGTGGATFASPAFCAASYPTTLDAGTITISGGGTGSLSIQSQAQNGITSYDTTLAGPPGGAYSISAAGSSSGVGPFTATSTIPPPITIRNNLGPGTPVSTFHVELDRGRYPQSHNGNVH